MNKPEMMVKLADHIVNLPKDQQYEFIFKMCEWISPLNLWAFCETAFGKEETTCETCNPKLKVQP